MKKWKRIPSLQEEILFDKVKGRASGVDFSTQAASRALLALKKKGYLEFIHPQWEPTDSGREYLIIWERVQL